MCYGKLFLRILRIFGYFWLCSDELVDSIFCTAAVVIV